MRAVICSEYGLPGSLVIGEVDRPAIRENEVRIKVHAAGVNFPDTLIIQGLYQLKPPMPFVPGFEVAGDVIEIGGAVNTHKVGDRVMALTSSGYGAFAEEAVAIAAEAVPIPNEVDYVTAAGLYTAYGTSYHALVQRGALRSGETLVVLGATGGVGLAAVEIGVALGANVIAVGRSEEKLAAAKARGANAVLCYTEENLGRQIKELTSGKGADVCLDTLGGPAFDQMSRAMNWNGRLLVVGFTSGAVPQLAVNLPLLKGYQLVGSYWGAFVTRSPKINAANFRDIVELLRSHRISPCVSATYPMDRVAEALTDLMSRRMIGKLVVTVSS